MLLVSKLNVISVGYFDPESIALHNETKCFSGWPERYFEKEALIGGVGEQEQHDQTISVAVLAEIQLRSPQIIFVFIIKKNVCWVKVSKNKII